MMQYLPSIKAHFLTRIVVRSAGFLCASILFASAGHAQAAGFDPGHIIDDGRFVKQTMDAPAVQSWLNTVNSTCLKNLNAPVPLGGGNYGGNVSAATVIAESARLNNINPQVLIATLQKEQGLVTRTDCPSWRYDTAMGFACPDTGACSDQFKGFNKQVYEGAKLLRNCFYQDKPGWYCSYVPYTTGAVKFSPDASCGSTQVYISNRATAALYTYTPYQPNAAVLNGNSDSCSTFGNLNFLYYMDYWFPDPTSSGFSLIKGASSPNQYLLQNFNGNLTIRLIPDPSVLLAWGLDKVTLQTVADSVVATTPRASPDLSRLSRPSGALTVYFMDNGQRHAIGSAEMMASWGLSAGAICDVSAAVGLIPTNSTDLAYAVRSTDSNDVGIYMMDGASLRQYQDPNTLMAWESDAPAVTTISAAYLSALPHGANLTNPRIIDASANQFLAQGGRKFALDPARAAIYPWTPQSVSAATLARLPNVGLAPVYLQGPGDPAVYLADNGQKHHITDPAVLSSWLAGQAVAAVPTGTLGLLPSGADLSSFFADNGGQLYVLGGSKMSVPSALDSAYRTNQTIFSASVSLLGILSSGPPVQGFIRAVGSPDISLLDSTGNRHHINTPRRWSLWDGDMSHVSTLAPVLVARYPDAGLLGVSVTDGTTEYVLESGSKLPVSVSSKADWRLNSPITLSSTTLARFPTGSPLASTVHSGASYSLVRSGLDYVTVDSNLANMWGLTTAPAHTPELVAELTQPVMLTRFVTSSQPGDQRVFTTDNGILYHLSPSGLLNLGYQSLEARASIDPSAMTGFSAGTWTADLVQDAAGKHYVIDGGTKRPFPSQIVQDFWTNNDALAVPQLSNGFLNLLPNNEHIERAIKSSGPNVYAGQGGQKRLITNPAVYASSYAPFIGVTDLLLSDLPTGPSI